ncbi:hypothetical protein Daus18300_004917 [Diaporthe australafricana]|uniref:Methyltransferase domain-containing protein n=1 Tax=Diaporthe australafricana TaxID=127596 RepID=A0ABR3X5H6_9PEZI
MMDSNKPQVPEDIKTKVKQTYNDIAAEYNAWTERNETTREDFLGRLLKLLPTTDPDRHLTVLELGCGAALTSTKTLLSVPGVNVVANDMSAAQIESAKKNLSKFSETAKDRVTWNEGDMMQLAFPDNSLDALVGLYSLIHLPREEQSELVARAFRWLRPGGHMLVNFTSGADEANINPNWLAEKGWMFWSGWGPENTAEIVKGAGFQIIESELRDEEGDASFFWVIARKE